MAQKDVTIFNYYICGYIRRNGSPLARTPSPRRRSHLHPHHDIGFSDTVSNVVEIVKEDVKHRGYRSNGRYPRGMYNYHISSDFNTIFEYTRNTIVGEKKNNESFRLSSTFFA